MKSSPKNKILFLLSLTFLSLLALFFIPPIPQDPAYHNFADKRTLLGIPNFWNVISNLPFLIVGVYGLILLQKKITGLSNVLFNLVISSGIVLISFGSAYYHYQPSHYTLVWDRIPMSLVFMGFFSFLVSERVHNKAGEIILTPLLITGIGSVLYWYTGEKNGTGDLRLYGWVQFFPILLSLLILFLFRKKDKLSKRLFLAMVWYGIAKLCETFDTEIFNMGGIISGHSLKHLLASASVWQVMMAAIEKQKE